MVRCRDGSIYTGIARDPVSRVREHNQGARGARYTRSRRPVMLIWSCRCGSLSQALRAEHRVKRMGAAAKRELAESGSGLEGLPGS